MATGFLRNCLNLFDLVFRFFQFYEVEGHGESPIIESNIWHLGCGVSSLLNAICYFPGLLHCSVKYFTKYFILFGRR